MSKTIFVVDDDPVIRILISEYLKTAGYQVCAIESAKACLERLFHETPDLMFVDMQMPGMNGAELLQVIRHTPEFAEIPVVILSAGSDIQEFTEKNYHVKANSYISKPFDISTLSSILEKLVPKSKPAGDISNIR